MADTAPKVTTDPGDKKPGGAGTGRPRGTATRNSASMTKIETGLKEWLGGIAMSLTFAGQTVPAVIIGSRGDALADAWVELARQNEGVRSLLLKMMEGSAWAGVIFSSLSIAMPIAQSYELIPATMPHPFMLKPEEIQKIEQLEALKNPARAANGDGE